jgi:hypothetical protein
MAMADQESTPSSEGERAPKLKAKRRHGKPTQTHKGSRVVARVFVAAEQLPRKSLEQALRIPRILREVFGDGPAKWADIAKALKVSPTPMNKYYLWAAQAYNLVQKEDESFSLSELGRKVLAPTKPNEDREALVQAVLTPVVFSRFFTDYNGSPFPADTHLVNVLEVRYNVPRERVEEAAGLLRENGLFAGILQQQPDGSTIVRLDPGTTGVPQPAEAPQPEESGEPTLALSVAAKGDFAKMCFVITPIGDDDSYERKHANLVLKNIIEPVVSELGLTALRADQIDRAGIITKQIFECLAQARICVADLSFNNPNAFYELGIRHICKLPTVQLIRKGDKIPFDVSQGRTIKIDMTDVYSVIESVESARKELRQHLKHALSGEYKGEDNPVNTYLPGAEFRLPK